MWSAKFFKDTLASHNMDFVGEAGEKFLNTLPSSLNIVDNQLLLHPISEAEVRVTIFSMKDYKYPKSRWLSPSLLPIFLGSHLKGPHQICEGLHQNGEIPKKIKQDVHCFGS